MDFFTAREILEQQPETWLGNAARDPIQPCDTFGRPDFFTLGEQPLATRNAGQREKIGVVGAGDVWEKFILPSLVQRGSTVYVYDIKFEASHWLKSDPEMSSIAAAEAAWREKDRFQELVQKAGAQCRIRIVEGNVNNLPNDLNYIMVLTPPSQHLDVVKQMMRKSIPIAVEKPLVATKQQAEELEELLASKPYPLYCIDWQAMHAIPVLDICGVKMPFRDALSVRVHDVDAYEQFRQTFDIRKVSMIDARLVEGGENKMGDIEVAIKKRAELFDYEKGGGLLFDMAVHPLNVLAILGFRVTGVERAFLGKPKKNEHDEYMPGIYQRFGKEEGKKSGETYGRAHLRMRIKGGNQDIETVIEAGKGAAANDGRLILADGKYELRWDIFPDEQNGKGSRLEIKDILSGKSIATSSLSADCYALVLQDIANFAKRGKREPLYLPEHLHIIRVISHIHEHARSQLIAKNELVRQLKLDERPNFHPRAFAQGKLAL